MPNTVLSLFEATLTLYRENEQGGPITAFPVWMGACPERLRMDTPFLMHETRPTGRRYPKKHSLVTTPAVEIERLWVTPVATLESFEPGRNRYTLDVVFEQEVSPGSFIWKRRTYYGVTVRQDELESKDLSSTAGEFIERQMFDAEFYFEDAGTGTAPSLSETVPLSVEWVGGSGEIRLYKYSSDEGTYDEAQTGVATNRASIIGSASITFSGESRAAMYVASGRLKVQGELRPGRVPNRAAVPRIEFWRGLTRVAALDKAGNLYAPKIETGTPDESEMALFDGATQVVSFGAEGVITLAVDELKQIVHPASIGGPVFGTPMLKMKIRPSGIATAEAFGSGRSSPVIHPDSIASEEAFGTPALRAVIRPLGIATAEDFGTLIIPAKITPRSISAPGSQVFPDAAAQWLFEEGANLAVDETGNGNDLAGTSSVVAGIEGFAAGFNGTGNLQVASDVAKMSGPDDYTLTGFIYIDSASGNCFFVGYGGEMNIQMSGDVMEVNVDSGGGGVIALFAFDVPRDEWVFFALQYEVSTKVYTLYVPASSSADYIQETGTTDITAAPGSLVIGDGLTGRLDNFTIFRRILTREELDAIADLSASGLARDAVGTPTVKATNRINGLTGIVSEEAIGTPLLKLYLKPGGIATGESVSALKVNHRIQPSGIASAIAFGSVVMGKQSIRPSGITTGEVISIPFISLRRVGVSGIASAEAFGSAFAHSTTLDNLVAYWQLDETTGIRVDATGRSNNLTEPYDAVGSSGGQINNGASFAFLSTSTLLKSGGGDVNHFGDEDMAMAGWIYNQADSAITQPHFWAWITGSGGFPNFKASLSFTGTDLEWVINGTTVTASGVSRAAWHHVVIYHDAANDKIGIIVDDGTPVEASHSTGFGMTSAGAQFNLAQVYSGNHYTGLMDEIGIWKGRLLSAAEITMLASADFSYPF